MTIITNSDFRNMLLFIPVNKRRYHDNITPLLFFLNVQLAQPVVCLVIRELLTFFYSAALRRQITFRAVIVVFQVRCISIIFFIRNFGEVFIVADDEFITNLVGIRWLYRVVRISYKLCNPLRFSFNLYLLALYRLFDF